MKLDISNKSRKICWWCFGAYAFLFMMFIGITFRLENAIAEIQHSNQVVIEDSAKAFNAMLVENLENQSRILHSAEMIAKREAKLAAEKAVMEYLERKDK